MSRLAIFIKSYKPDVALLSRLLTSIEKHNVEEIPVVVSVPEEDISLFKRSAHQSNVTFVLDSIFGIPVVSNKIHNFSIGYVQQQMVKLSVHRLDIADAYAVIDSDSFFIRDFFYRDFMDETDRGFTVLVEDKDQFAAPWYSSFAEGRQSKINIVADYFSLPAQPRATCHNNTIFSADVLTDFDSWREDKGLTLVNAMEIAPIEFSWYNFFMQKFHSDKIVRIEPFMRMVHTRGEYRSLIQQGISISDLRRSYLGVCINSGWAGRDQKRLVKKMDTRTLAARWNLKLDEMKYVFDQKVDRYRFGKND